MEENMTRRKEDISPRKAILADMESKHAVPESSSSSSSSRKSSSDSASSLSDQELDFHELCLHPKERNFYNNSLILDTTVHKALSLPKCETGINVDLWMIDEPLTQEKLSKQCSSCKTALRVISESPFRFIQKEDVLSYFREKENETIIECSGYTKKEIVYFINRLNLNAVIGWELLANYGPDKYQKFGPKLSLTILNQTTKEKKISELGEELPIKILQMSKLMIIFSSVPLDFEQIIPEKIKSLSSQSLLFLILQQFIERLDEKFQEVNLKVQELYISSQSTSNFYTRSSFVSKIGEVSSVLLHLKSLKYQKIELLKSILQDNNLSHYFRYLIRFLKGKLKILRVKYKETKLLLKTSKHFFGTMIDQKNYTNSQDIDSYFKIVMIFSALIGIPDAISTYMGMNVRIPGQDSTSYFPFFAILGVSLLLSTLLFFVLKCFDYIQ